jgi:putative CocE/NonD family hydrolase
MRQSLLNYKFMLRLLFPLFLLTIQGRSFQAGEPDRNTQSKPVHLKPTVLAKFVGQFRVLGEPERIYSFSTDDTSLYVQSAHLPKTALTAVSKREFSSDNGSVHYLFSKDEHGKCTELKVSNARSSASASAVRISDQPEQFRFRPYTRQDVMIPVRDGTRLHAVVLRPSDTAQPLPLLLTRTPYGVDDWTPPSLNARALELAEGGYIFVEEDIRGRYKSEGKFVMMRPIADHSDPKQVDESTDAYDTVDWLVKNIPNNNGRVGVMGVSYPGFLTAEAGIDPHPAVKAISPQAPMTDVWIGDDFFHNGAFRETYGYDYVVGLESSKENAFGKLDQDAYDYFLNGGSFLNVARGANINELPTSQAFVEHPNYDTYWRSRAVEPHLTRVAVPTLLVGGWWDQEDMWGPQAEYAALEPHDTSHENFLVLGPWNHGQWAATTRHLGDLDFGAPIGEQFRKQIEVPFFAHYLKDENGFDLKDTASFQTGSNRWMRYDQWPPKEGVKERNLYLAGNGSLTFDRPAGTDDASVTAYVSDPANPVPYRKRPIEATYAPNGSGWYTWLVQDQRFLEGRKDVVSWTTAALDQPLTVTGDVIADLFASTSGTDGDWVVKLVDVYPEDPKLGKLSGDELMIASEIFRGRYWKSSEAPEPLPADQIVEYKFSLHGADHVFLKGHRIMVQIQSTWFPLYDRNPQQFVPNIMTAGRDEYKIAKQRVFWSADHPSHIELPVAEEQIAVGSTTGPRIAGK